jgi:hypothetical protein
MMFEIFKGIVCGVIIFYAGAFVWSIIDAYLDRHP